MTSSSRRRSPRAPEPSAGVVAPTSSGRRRLPWRFGAAALVLVLAAAGYWWWVPVHQSDATRLAPLVPHRSPAGFGTKPSSAGPVPASRTSISAVENAAHRSPDATASYAIAWSGRKTKNAAVEVLLTLLPSAAQARTARTQAVRHYLGTKSLQSSGYRRSKRFTPTSVPGAAGALFVPASTGASTGKAAVAVLSRGRAVAVVLADAKGTTARSAVTTAAQRTWSRLGGEAAVSLELTTYPLVASVLYAAATAVLVTVVLGAAPARARLRRRRQAAWARAVERERRSRGRKVVRRRATGSRSPAWRPRAAARRR